MENTSFVITKYIISLNIFEMLKNSDLKGSNIWSISKDTQMFNCVFVTDSKIKS